MYKNIFVVGPEVTGESFIGKKANCSDIKSYIDNNEKFSLSITGIARIGKSSLIANAIDKQYLRENKILYYSTALADYDSFKELWYDIASELFSQAEEYFEDKDLSAIEKKWNRYEKDKDNNALKNLLKALKKAEIRAVVVIDEFDSARTKFSQAEFSTLRTIASSSDYSLSVILISRRALRIISNQEYENSTFHGAFKRIVNYGFDSDDKKCYYELLEKNYGIVLDEEQRQLLDKYAGVSPYLFSLFGHSLVEAAAAGRSTNIDDIYNDESVRCNILQLFNDIIKYMKEDSSKEDGSKEDGSKKDGSYEQITAYMFGPSYKLNSMDAKNLKDTGFLVGDENKPIIISEKFTNYFRIYYEKIDKHNDENLYKILSFQERIQCIIRRELNNQIKTSSKCSLNDALTNRYRFDNEQVERWKTFIESTKKDFGVQLDYIDVMSIKDANYIILEDWDRIFRKYFIGMEKDDYSKKSGLIAKARNPYAHGQNDRLIGSEMVSLIDQYCSDLMQLTVDWEHV